MLLEGLGIFSIGIESLCESFMVFVDLGDSVLGDGVPLAATDPLLLPMSVFILRAP